MTEPEPLQQIERTYARFQGRKVSYFSGCDYFRLANDSRLAKALIHATQKYGINVSASRLTSGNHVVYQELERSLADFFEAPSALLVPTGYQANLIVAQALAGHFSHALIDEYAHPSLSDAAQLLNCPVIRFKHCSTEDVHNAIRRCGSDVKLLLFTDGVFSKDGSLAPLAEYVRALPKDSWLLVDDAHGAGVLGASGKGSFEYAGLSRRKIVQTVTLSKAFGTYGGAILGSVGLRQSVLERSHIYVGSTPVPLPVASAAITAIEIVKKHGNLLRRRLSENTDFVRSFFKSEGLPVENTPAPIVSIEPQTVKEILEFTRCLLAARIYPPYIKYPGAQEIGCFRFAISSEHRRSQLEDLLKAVKCFFLRKRLGRKARKNSLEPLHAERVF